VDAANVTTTHDKTDTKQSGNSSQSAQSQSSGVSQRTTVQLKGKSYEQQLTALSPSAGGFAAQEAAVRPQDAAVQAKDGDLQKKDVHDIAAQGTQGSGGSLPYLDKIQSSFGSHDVSNVQAYSGGNAVAANESLGANAYASGNKVAFKGSTDLHTAAHEAAHIVQQRSGVSLSGGVGQSGDSYEQHADAVADAVVQGKSAEGLLNRFAGGSPGASHGAATQLKEEPKATGAADAASKKKTARSDTEVSELCKLIVQSIAQKETKQKAKESLLKTSAGVSASYASQVQQIASWTVGALRASDDATRKKYKLTKKDLSDINKRIVAASELWKAVVEKGSAGDEKNRVASGLTKADVEKMKKFRKFKSDVQTTQKQKYTATGKEKKQDLFDRANKRNKHVRGRAEVRRVKDLDNAKKYQSLRKWVSYYDTGAALAVKDPAKTLKITPFSIATYARGGKWREDKAAWERRAAETNSTQGEALKTAATDDRGLALGTAKLTVQAKAFLKTKPEATDKEVVYHVAEKHNKGKKGHDTVWGHFQTYKKAADKAKKAAGKTAAP
jgi:hypothetical protein